MNSTKLNLVHSNHNTTFVKNGNGATKKQTAYMTDSSDDGKPNTANTVKIRKRRVKRKQRKDDKTSKLITYAKSHPKIDKQYDLVKLTWDKSNNPVVECSDNITNITTFVDTTTNRAGYIFILHEGVVKVGDNQYLNTATGAIINQPANSNEIEWQGSYLQKFANNKTVPIKGDRTTINNLPAKNSINKGIFDNSDSESFLSDYAGFSSEDEVFLTANSEISDTDD